MERSKQINLCNILENTISVFNIVELMLTIKMVWQNVPSELSPTWLVPCYYMPRLTGSMASIHPCGQWQFHMQPTFIIICLEPMVSLPVTFSLAHEFLGTNCATSMSGVVQYMYWTLPCKLARKSHVGNPGPRGEYFVA